METTFTAWDVSRYGGPDVLKPVSRIVPTPKPGQVPVSYTHLTLPTIYSV